MQAFEHLDHRVSSRISETVHVVDFDVARRARICRELSGFDITALPFESISELCRKWPDSGCILVGSGEAELISAIMNSVHSEHVLPVVGYSEQPSLEEVCCAFRVGSAGFLAWRGDAAKFIEELSSSIAMGAANMRIAGKRARARQKIENLSSREKEVLAAMSDGRSNKEIALSLGISYRTVEIHRSNMMSKVNASNSIEAARVAWEAGMPMRAAS